MKKYILLVVIFSFGIGSLYFLEPHEFVVKGVKDGDVYAEDVNLHVETGLIQPSITLNGKEIHTKKTINQNGSYTLKVKSRFLWKEKRESMTFKRDDEPPLKPVLLEEPKNAYFQSASFQVKEEPGVKYKATLGKDPYLFGDEITTEGKHTLYLVAEKDNGLVAKNDYTFKIDNRTYSQQEVDTFSDFYFKNSPEIWKYKSDTVVFVHGNPKPEDVSRLKSDIQNLNNLLPFNLKYEEKITGLPDRRIDVHFMPTYEFNQMGFDGKIIDGNRKIIGVAVIDEAYRSFGIKASTILIGTETDQQERLPTITHELMHALGLHSHFETDRSSILYPDVNSNVQTWNEKDLKTLEILYHPNVTIGMEKEEFLNSLKDWVTN
ncbi:DUF2927 domain-containing protein [Pseudalkalibacillus sp. Hm43]|uniref:DUF2927 domain-containing protein n=1 Tax=Pseudalkalibacillus sp. Hm43 TaxID=3450742 RepID=UPI003F4267ED